MRLTVALLLVIAAFCTSNPTKSTNASTQAEKIISTANLPTTTAAKEEAGTTSEGVKASTEKLATLGNEEATTPNEDKKVDMGKKWTLEPNKNETNNGTESEELDFDVDCLYGFQAKQVLDLFSLEEVIFLNLVSSAFGFEISPNWPQEGIMENSGFMVFSFPEASNVVNAYKMPLGSFNHYFLIVVASVVAGLILTQLTVLATLLVLMNQPLSRKPTPQELEECEDDDDEDDEDSKYPDKKSKMHKKGRKPQNKTPAGNSKDPGKKPKAGGNKADFVTVDDDNAGQDTGTLMADPTSQGGGGSVENQTQENKTDLRSVK
ncbi:hypothetical protein L596_009582 [Steinernema carpocapsae]|uniref:Uncharacterized protein n=1 Tax=Steinernema carpocapsae TaxID=34508 RepID=A0A4U5PFZ0_STECR|nr:hypothetical protein L596_009582 [Steinernema carpocapsae]